MYSTQLSTFSKAIAITYLFGLFKKLATAGPIVYEGQLAGTINFARYKDTPSFSSQDIVNASALCLHISAILAKLRSQPQFFSGDRSLARLSDRELQIANLVARGFTNAKIGRELWITENTVKQTLKRIFRKLEVSARTEMVAKLTNLART